MTGYYDQNLQALDQVEDLLEAYADARLAPTGPVLARMRSAMLARAAANAATQRRLAATAPPPSHWAFPSVHLPRRAFALGMAAALTLSTSAAVFAAPPGSPFFNARVALESAFLPSQSEARFASREQHLDERLAEAEAAAATGDYGALDAALAAYRVEVDATVDEGQDLDRLAHLEAMLAKHVAVLEVLEGKVPEQASIEKAIVSSQKAVERVKEKAKEKASQGHPTPKPNRPQNGSPNGPPNGPPNGQRGRE